MSTDFADKPEDVRGFLGPLLTQARAEGRREGIEEAAKWHDEQYSRLQAENSEMVRKFGLPDHERLNDAYNHKAHAAGIRALATAAGKDKP